jgi:hypothetical protein
MAVTLVDRAIPGDVLEFASQRQLLPHLERALRLAESTFLTIRQLSMGVEADPDSDEQYIVIDVTMDLEADEVLRRDDAYTRAWVASTPPDVRSHIRLLYHFA